MFKNLNEKDKKKIYSLLSLGIICVIALIVIPSFSKEEIKKEEVLDQEQVSQYQQDESKNHELETKLEEILSKIDGAGEVDVMITFDSSEELQPAYNSNLTTEKTQEKDQKGGERTVTTSSENKTMITSSTDGPIILKTNEAKIKGVIVVASGAKDSKVKEIIYSAVQTALQVAGHQVEVY